MPDSTVGRDEHARASPIRGDAPMFYAVIAGVAFGIYLLTLTNNFTDGEDALRYVRNITIGEDVWRFGNHLIFNFAGMGWFGLWRAMGYADNALLPMQVLSAASAAISVGLTAWVGRRIGLSAGLAVSAAVGMAVSSCFWAYGVLPDTYAVPIPFVLFGFVCLLRALREEHCSGGAPAPWVLAATLSWSIATILHQQNVLFFGPGALMLVWESASRRAGLRWAALLLGLGCALTLGSYILVAVYGVGLRSVPDFVRWTMGYAKDGPWTPWSWMSLPKGLVGLLRSVFAINLAFGVDAVAQVAQRAVPNMLLVEERYFAEYLRPATLYAALAGLAASALVALALVAILARRWFSTSPHVTERIGGQRRIALWLGLMAASQAIPVIAWEPINPEFWVATLPWFWLLIAWSIHRNGDRRARGLWWAFIALLGLTNAMGYVFPQTDPDSDYWRQANALPLRLLNPGDQMITTGGYVSDGYLGLQSRRLVISGVYGIGEVHRRVVATPTQSRLVVSSWLADPPAFLVGNSQLDLWDRAEAQRLLSCYRPNLELLGQSADQTVWELRRPVPNCAGA